MLIRRPIVVLLLLALVAALVVPLTAASTRPAGAAVWDWTQESPTTNPTARKWGAMTYDTARAEAVLFGGLTGTPATTRLGDTWTWNGTDWTQESPAHSPSPRNNAVMAFDPVRGVVVLFGGQSANGMTYYNDTAPVGRGPNPYGRLGSGQPEELRT